MVRLYLGPRRRLVFLCGRDHHPPMGRRTKMHKVETIDLAVTLLGVVGFLGFLAAARMSNSFPFDVAAMVWFATFGAIKVALPLLLEKRGDLQDRRAGRRVTY